MNVKIIGSGHEVGKSAIMIETKNASILLDYGVRVQPEPPQYPPRVNADSAIISHAHLDHSGATPFLVQNKKTKIFMNDITLELADMLIEDSMKVSRKNGFGEPFSPKDIEKMVKSTKIVTQNEHFNIGTNKCTLYHSGHIPGSSSILVEGDKKIYYTSDIQTEDTELLKRCQLPENADILITESTYSYKESHEREKDKRRFMELIEEAVSNEQTVLIPCFALGRSQEILLMLEKYADLIALDGMAKRAARIILQYPYYLKNPKKYREVIENIKFIEDDRQKKKAIKDYPIIISSSGMLGGGPSVYYLRKIKDMADAHILFTGFLVDGTPGKDLLKTKIFQNKKERFAVKCDVQKFDFSAHADSRGLFDIIDRVQPETVLAVHGERCEEFAKNIQETTGIKAYAPKNKDVFNF